MLNKVNHWLDIALEALFPHICVLCNSSPTLLPMDLCQACHAHLPWIKMACQRCGRQATDRYKNQCKVCLVDPPLFDIAYTPFHYLAPIDKLIIQYKHEKKLVCGRVLRELFTQFLLNKSELVIPDAIIPVPLHPKRLRERGFNQTSQLAKNIAKALRIPIIENFVRRIQHTSSQMQLSAKNRKFNLVDIFRINPKVMKRNLCRVAIVDDVMTTGSTIHAICQILKEHGINHIQIWTLASTEVRQSDAFLSKTPGA